MAKGKQEFMKRFKRIYVEINNRCNLSCDFCPKTKRNAAMMSVDFFSSILEQIKDYTDSIYMHIMGEPLMHPNFSHLLGCCKEHGIDVSITTNGTLLSTDFYSTIENKDVLKQINISLHSYGGGAVNAFDEHYINSIFDFVDLAQKDNIYINYRLWNGNGDDVKTKNESLIKRLQDKYPILDEQWNAWTPNNKGLRLSKKVLLHQAQQFKWPRLGDEEIFTCGICYGLRTHVGILVDGTVVPCCLDGEGTMPLGNIKEKPFNEIINSKKATAIYNAFSENTPIEDTCKTCGFHVVNDNIFV